MKKWLKITICSVVCVSTIGIGIGSKIAVDDSNSSNFNFKRYLNSEIYFDANEAAKQLNPILYEQCINNISYSFGKNFFSDWYKSLTYNGQYETNPDGSLKNLFINSERLGLFTYVNCWGHFWNMYLHKNITPPNSLVDKSYLYEIKLPQNQPSYEIRGEDYQYVESALNKGESPFNLVVYHGVEWLETEYWDQLSEFITKDGNGNYDYSNCVGKTLTSYGWLSTTLNSRHAFSYSGGENWTKSTNSNLHTGGPKEPPLKEPFVFKIKVPAGERGLAYISNFNLVDGFTMNYESQVLIGRNKRFVIEAWKKSNGVNIFELKMTH